jgi:hypothetical protein
VLQDHSAVDEIEAVVGEPTKPAGSIQLETAAIGHAIDRTRSRDHRWRDVETDDAIETRGQGLTHPTDAAPEIESTPSRASGRDTFEILNEPVDFVTAGRQELLNRPFVALFVGPGQDGPERIAAS